mmetsp:Transcript_87262/g.150661  ORF Transcript_87262/g.150661 Transcript_87262/m.150661 type:complete len:346 (+) Transcript_87262:31-1068(+)
MAQIIQSPFEVSIGNSADAMASNTKSSAGLKEVLPLVPAGEFYETYHGHRVTHLESVQAKLREAGAEGFIYLAGDSSLDNKHWFFESHMQKCDQLFSTSDFVGEAVNGYEKVLKPANMVKDVCYWVNKECAERNAQGVAPKLCALNTAVEESCIVQRELNGLLPQDAYIRDNITESDVLVVDVGGNDVALSPTKGVMINIAWLLYLTPKCFIQCGPLLAPGLIYFIHMFRVRLRRYIEKLIAIRKPKKIVICMLYFLDESPDGGWADGVLAMLGYDKNPSKLQAVMRKVYSWGVSQIRIPGVEVVSLPLYEVLDGKDTADYVQRVEPSVTGGQKMAAAIAERIFS